MDYYSGRPSGIADQVPGYGGTTRADAVCEFTGLILQRASKRGAYFLANLMRTAARYKVDASKITKTVAAELSARRKRGTAQYRGDVSKALK